MFDRLRNILSDPDPETIPPDAAVERFRTENSDVLNQAQEQGKQLRSTVLDGLDDTETVLEELQSYESDHTRVADVTTNIATTRLRTLDQFDAPDDLQRFQEQASQLVQELRSVTQKERAVLDHVGAPASTVFKRLDAVEDDIDRLEQFLDDDHAVIQHHQKLESLVDQWQQLREEKDRLETALADIDTDTPRSRLETVEQNLDALDDDPEQDRKETLQQEITQLEDDRDALQRDVKQAASKMERGLKKVLYAARNGDVSLDREHIDVLETIKNGSLSHEFTTPAADVSAAVNAAKDAVEDVDLSDRNREKFRNGAETLQHLDDIRTETEQITTHIQEKQDALADLDIDDRRAALERKKDRIQATITDRAEERKELRRQIRETREDIEATRQEIEDVLNRHVRADVTVET